MNSTSSKAAYLAGEGFIEHVKDELKSKGVRITKQHDRLLLTEQPPVVCHWAQNTWQDLNIVSIESVGDAVKKLKSIQRNWAEYSFQLHRRSALIQEQLPKYIPTHPQFMQKIPSGGLGSFSLLGQNSLAYSPQCTAVFPNGEVVFAEDKVNPPSRAYLKLWELFTMEARQPSAEETCLELGASPGGWTWVIAQSAKKVIALDRAPLADNVARLSNIEFRQGNAFAAKPQPEQSVEWLFSDIICYPDKLFEFLQPWLADERVRHFVCTLKFQGQEHYGVIKDFEAIAGSRIYHLSHNKHELTWVLHR